MKGFDPEGIQDLLHVFIYLHYEVEKKMYL